MKRINKNAEKKKILTEFPGKFSIFAVVVKTLIRIERKPQNSESATSKTNIETEFTKMQK